MSSRNARGGGGGNWTSGDITVEIDAPVVPVLVLKVVKKLSGRVRGCLGTAPGLPRRQSQEASGQVGASDAEICTLQGATVHRSGEQQRATNRRRATRHRELPAGPAAEHRYRENGSGDRRVPQGERPGARFTCVARQCHLQGATAGALVVENTGPRASEPIRGCRRVASARHGDGKRDNEMPDPGGHPRAPASRQSSTCHRCRRLNGGMTAAGTSRVRGRGGVKGRVIRCRPHIVHPLP